MVSLQLKFNNFIYHLIFFRHLKFDETESHFEKFQISFVFDCSIEQQNSLLVIEYKVNIGSATYNDTANVNPKGITEIVLWNIESSKISNYLIDGSLNVEAHCTLKMLIPKSIKKESQYLSTEITDLGVPKDYLNRYRYSFSANDDERNIHAF